MHAEVQGLDTMARESASDAGDAREAKLESRKQHVPRFIDVA